MSDPDEGVAADGTITTGVARDRVAPRYEPLLAEVVDAVDRAATGAGVHLYGSVATGRARIPESDVDLLTVGLPRGDATVISTALSSRFATLCRGVEIASAGAEELAVDSDESYGFRVFLRHYCVHLAGPDHGSRLPAFPADARAARGFNGDVADHLDRWRRDAAAEQVDWARLGRRIARKLLLATAGLVSVRDGTWTTDLVRAAHRWAELDPLLAADLSLLLAWSTDARGAEPAVVDRLLTTTAPQLVDTFAAEIGLWS